MSTQSGAAVGGSGAEAWTNDAASATAALDDNTTITASGTVSVTAHNAFTESTSAPSVQSGAGGVISGNAAQNHTTLDGVANTFDDTTNDVSAGVFLGNSVSITSGTDPFQSPGRVLLNAYSTLDAVDNVTIQAYGVFAGGGADSEVDATLNNYVVIGQDNTITSDGNIGAGTHNSVNAQALSSSTSGSAVGAAQASGYVTINSNQTVTVGTGTTIKAFGNINLTAGDDPTGQYSTNIYAVTNTQAYGDGLIDIPVTYYNASITSNTALNIENNTDIESGSNVIIGAVQRLRYRQHVLRA